MKRCYTCGETKERSGFHKARSRYDGLQAYCKACRADYSRTDAGKALRTKRDAKRFAKHPEKRKARDAVSNAVKANRIPPPSALMCACECGRSAEQYHHFNGYDPEHWFEIDGYTVECHRDLHHV